MTVLSVEGIYQYLYTSFYLGSLTIRQEKLKVENDMYLHGVKTSIVTTHATNYTASNSVNEHKRFEITLKIYH